MYKNSVVSRYLKAILILAMPIIIVISAYLIVKNLSQIQSVNKDIDGVNVDELVSTAKELEEYQKLFQMSDIDVFKSYPDINKNNLLDPMQYFIIFKHLKIDSNVVLDFVYPFNTNFGAPVLYFRYKNENPILCRKVNILSNEIVDSRIEEFKKRFFIHIDSSKNSFLELALFYLQGEQFYLSQHACYNDMKMLYTYKDFINTERYISSDPEFREDFKPLLEIPKNDYLPSVNFIDNIAIVQYYYLTKWGGIYKKILKISRKYPHEILFEHSTQVIKFNCGGHF